MPVVVEEPDDLLGSPSRQRAPALGTVQANGGGPPPPPLRIFGLVAMEVREKEMKRMDPKKKSWPIRTVSMKVLVTSVEAVSWRAGEMLILPPPNLPRVRT